MVDYVKMPFSKLAGRLKPVISKLEKLAPKGKSPPDPYVATRFLNIFNSKKEENLVKRYSSKIFKVQMARVPMCLLHRIAEAEFYLSSV